MANISSELQKKIDNWLEWDANPSTRDEILALVKNENVSELQKRLGTRIAFGTAGSWFTCGASLCDADEDFEKGLRGTMQAGFNSMNTLTVIQASQVMTSSHRARRDPHPLLLLHPDCCHIGMGRKEAVEGTLLRRLKRDVD